MAYIGASTPAFGTDSVTATWPAAYTPTAGDFAIIVTANGPNSGATAPDFGTPTDWDLRARNNDIIGWDSAAGDQSVFTRHLAGGDTLPTFTNPSGAYYVVAYTLVFSDIHATTPMDATPVLDSTTSATWQPTGITTVTANAYVLTLFCNPRFSHSPTGTGYAANGFTNVVTTTGTTARGASAAGYLVKASAGAQTMPTYVSDSDTICHIAMALRPVGVTAELNQEGFRWRADDGSETTATWLAAQDTAP